MVNAQDAGATVVLISNSDNTGFMRMNPDAATPGFAPPTITIPSASMPRNSAAPLLAALASRQVRKAQLSCVLPSAHNHEAICLHAAQLCRAAAGGARQRAGADRVNRKFDSGICCATATKRN